MATETFSPKWAPHCVGSFDRSYDEDGKPEPTWVELSCSVCGAAHRAKCESGAPRDWVLRWANAHLHRDALKDPFPGGSR